ncbi:rhamnogalacturonan endolyase YesW [Bacteroidia bacterium]|nr:rhamnogalacturonan endolyase YesW [Bacteroidia bacterium]
MRKKIFNGISTLVLLTVVMIGSFQCTPEKTSKAHYNADGVQTEFLNRGVVAFTRADSSIYIGWRLLEDDPADIAFNVYRKLIGAVPDNDYVKVNREPITSSTNYVDKGSDYFYLEGNTPKIHEAHMYKVTQIVNGREEEVPGGETYVFFSLGDKNYRSILLEDVHKGVQEIGIGDLDGDGAYDFVVLRDALVGVDPGTCETCWSRSRDTYQLEAYSSEGKFLWRYDMGWAIETGGWLAPFMVYDLDGDGKAEVYTKAGEGDPRSPDGRVLTGPEYLVKIDGMTGKIVQKRDWIPRNIEKQRSYDWTSRNFLGIAYLDGKKPSLIMQRGNYGLIKIEALDKNLNREWYFESSGENEKYWGNGGHNIRVADIDEDGKDELVPGPFAIDHDGKGLWCLGLFHNDGSEVTDIDPERPGLEIFYNIETGIPRNGLCLVDAATGEYIMEYDKQTWHIHGQATIGDWDPAHPGMECYARPEKDVDPTHPFLFSAKGERLSDSFFIPGILVYWDDDDYKEFLGGGKVFKFGGDTLSRGIQGSYGDYIIDLFGDWREEIITRFPGEIRIYSSTLPASNKKVTLMQDHQYRMHVASFSAGYITPPQMGLQKNSLRKYTNK